MGVTAAWISGLRQVLGEKGIASELIPDTNFVLLKLAENHVVVNCISIQDRGEPEQVIALQTRYFDKGIQFVSLWEDVWRCRQPQVLNRINSLAGENKRIHGRKSRVVSLDKHQADVFLSEFHIQGPVLARYKFGLEYEDELVAVATFSAARMMRHHGEGYRSTELIRFATRSGYTVTGGLSKLLKHFTAQINTNDVMTYADRDWSNGKGYEAAGFTFHSSIPSAELWLDTSTNKRYFPHRLPDGFTEQTEGTCHNENDQRFVKIFNTGSLKYILYL